MNDTVMQRGAHFIYANARLLETAVCEHLLLGGSAEAVVSALRAYQMPDGGFGHALEPDLRAPDSQPLYIDFAFSTLHQCRLRAPDLALRACDYLAAHADLTCGIPFILPSSQLYPRAAHWEHAHNLEPRIDVLIGLVGLLNWQGIAHPWLALAVPRCLELLETIPLDDAHTLSSIFILAESLPQDAAAEKLFNRLAAALPKASFYIPYAPATGYGLTPLEFAPTPDAFCRPLFNQAQLDGHLDELLAKQGNDGGWPISWNPHPGAALCEWRGRATVLALATLRAYGRI